MRTDCCLACLVFVGCGGTASTELVAPSPVVRPIVSAERAPDAAALPEAEAVETELDAARPWEEVVAAKRKLALEAAQRAGDSVRVEPGAWTLESVVRGGGPALRFRVQGALKEGDEGQVFVLAREHALGGPATVSVYEGGRLVQTLRRRAPTPDALDLDSFAQVDPLSLTREPLRDEEGVHAGDIELADVNFDGALDLHVTVGLAHKCPIVQRFLFEPSTRKFVEHKALGQLGCLSWIPDRKLLVSAAWSCCEDWISVYRWEGRRLVIEREIWRERAQGGKATITYHEVRDGKSVTRVEQTVSEKAEP